MPEEILQEQGEVYFVFKRRWHLKVLEVFDEIEYFKLRSEGKNPEEMGSEWVWSVVCDPARTVVPGERLRFGKIPISWAGCFQGKPQEAVDESVLVPGREYEVSVYLDEVPSGQSGTEFVYAGR